MSKEQVITALARLQEELSRLEPAIEHIEAAKQVTDAVAEIPRLYQEFGATLTKTVEDNLEASAAVNRRLQETTASLLDEMSEERRTLEALRNQVKNFHDRIEMINLPQRLDKIDVSVAGIMSAVQTLQNRVDNLERAVTDKFQTQQQALQKLQDETGQRFRRTQNFLLGNLIIAILILILLTVKMFIG